MPIEHVVGYGENRQVVYSYEYASQAARACLKQYHETYQQLSNRLCIKSLGDGFVVGSLTAGAYALWMSECSAYEKKLLCAAVATLIVGMTIYQNYGYGTVPYYSNGALVHGDNWFNCWSVIGRSLCGMMGAGAGFFGVGYVLGKV
jgi:hypothetical protein